MTVATVTEAMPAMMETEALVRRYGSAPALRGVCLDVAPGERVALLGPNGAGKTTLLKVLSTLLRPTSGTARIAGADVAAQGSAVRRRIGVAGHQSYLYDDLTVEENLTFYARLYGLADTPAVVQCALHTAGLWERRHQRVRVLSRGLLQRASLARALLHDPPILLLDEPDTGLDTAGLRWLGETLAGGRRTVVLTTHAPDRASAWCDRSVTLVDGQIAAHNGASHNGATGAHLAHQVHLAHHPPAGPLSSLLPGPPGPSASFLMQVRAVLWKDLLLEWRTRELLSATAVFAVLALLVFTFALDLRTENAALVAPGVLWVAFIFAGLLALGRTMALERDRGTLDGLRLAPLDRGALYLAKTAANALFMLAVEALLLPVFTAFFNLPILQLRLAPVLALGTLGFSAVGTLFAAMASNLRAREALLPVLLLPVAVPVVIGSVKATAAVVDGTPFGPWLSLLGAFDALFLAVCFCLFEFVLED